MSSEHVAKALFPGCLPGRPFGNLPSRFGLVGLERSSPNQMTKFVGQCKPTPYVSVSRIDPYVWSLAPPAERSIGDHRDEFNPDTMGFDDLFNWDGRFLHSLLA